MKVLFWENKATNLVLYQIITFLIDLSFASSFISVVVNDLSAYYVVKNFTTWTYTECGMRCGEDLRCDAIFVDEVGDGLKQCLLLSDNKTMANGTERILNETTNGNCTMFKVSEDVKLATTKKPLVNIALNKPSYMSSNHGHKGHHLAKQGNDGNLNNMASTNEKDDNQWWEVDLQKVVNIKLVKLYLRQMNISKKRYEVMDIKTRVKASDQWALCAQIKSPKTSIVETTCDSNSNARYVAIWLQMAQTNLVLHEVEIYEDL